MHVVLIRRRQQGRRLEQYSDDDMIYKFARAGRQLASLDKHMYIQLSQSNVYKEHQCLYRHLEDARAIPGLEILEAVTPVRGSKSKVDASSHAACNCGGCIGERKQERHERSHQLQAISVQRRIKCPDGRPNVS